MKLFRIVHFLLEVFEILTLFRCPGFFAVLGLVTVKFAYDDFTFLFLFLFLLGSFGGPLGSFGVLWGSFGVLWGPLGVFSRTQWVTYFNLNFQKRL